MSLEKAINSIRAFKFAEFVDKALSSVFFPVVTAAVTLVCYYTGLDVVLMWYLAVCGVLTVVFCDDATPVLLIFLFLNVMISGDHNPSAQFGVGSDYFSRPEVLGAVIAAGVIFVAAVLSRVIIDILCGRFKVTPVFWGVTAFMGGLILNGAFSVKYSPMSLLFGLMLALIILLVFVFVSGGVKVNEKTCKKIAYYLIALFAVAFIELIVLYCTREGLIVDGVVNRSLISFGWGTYNNMGLVLTITVPAWFYLALKFKFGQFFLIGAVCNMIASLLCMSRQCILMSAVVFVVCCVWLLIASKGTNRIINACIIGGVLIVAAIVFGINHEYFFKLFSRLADSMETGSNRTILWKEGIDAFLNEPVFGKGFFDYTVENDHVGYAGSDIFSFIPFMCHNTVVQLLCCGGLVGIATYGVHRVQTVISFFKRINSTRVFLALVTLAFVLVSLLDNHMFYISTTVVYIMFAALFDKSERDAI